MFLPRPVHNESGHRAWSLLSASVAPRYDSVCCGGLKRLTIWKCVASDSGMVMAVMMGAQMTYGHYRVTKLNPDHNAVPCCPDCTLDDACPDDLRP